MTARRHLTPDEQAAVRRLHAQGRGRNEISRETGVPRTSLTKFCEEAGLSFEVPASTAAAVKARSDRCRALRAELAETMLLEAKKLLGQMSAPSITFNIGGKDNVYTEHEIPEPTFADKRNIMQAASTAVTASTRLTTYDGDGDEEAMKSAIVQLFGALKVAWDGSHPPEEPTGEE